MTPEDRAAFARIMDAACAELGVPAWGTAALGELSALLPGRDRPRAASLAAGGGSAVLLALPYYAGEFPLRNLSRHAVGDDYHRVAGGILAAVIDCLAEVFPKAVFLPFVDNSPIPEVEAAARAGLGRQGKHRQLITPGYGSYIFLCEIVIDLALPATGFMTGDPCKGCGLCIRACPTGALGEEGLDAARCRSRVTQKKGDLTPWEAEQIRLGGLVWGCDICLDVCPRNHAPALTPIAAFRQNLTPLLTEAALDRLLPQKSYGWRGRGPLLRNLKIIAGEGEPHGDSPAGGI